MLGGQFVAAAAAPNFPCYQLPVAYHGAGAAFRAVFEVPLAYSDDDLARGHLCQRGECHHAAAAHFQPHPLTSQR
jgi:hypothetical protein